MFRSLKGKVTYWVTFNEMNHIDPQTEASDILLISLRDSSILRLKIKRDIGSDWLSYDLGQLFSRKLSAGN